MNGSHCWPTGLLFNQDRSGLIKKLEFSLTGFITLGVRFFAHCSQSTMFYLLWHTCGTLNHLTWWCRKMFSCFQFVVGSVSHFSCIWLAHIAGPPVSCSIRVGPGGYILATNLIIFHPNMFGMNILPQFWYYHTLEIMMFLETKKVSDALKSQIKSFHCWKDILIWWKSILFCIRDYMYNLLWISFHTR